MEGDRCVVVVIPGPPLAQPRPRMTTVSGHARAYEPVEARSWKGAAQVHMRQALEEQLEDAGVPYGPQEPVGVWIDAEFACPKSDWRKRKPRPMRFHTKQGDLDNIVKAVLDAGNGVLWHDDKQVASVNACKVIAEQGSPPRVVLIAKALKE